LRRLNIPKYIIITLTLTGMVSSVVEAAPDLVVTSLAMDTNPIVQPQSTIIRWTIKNQGNAEAIPVNYWLRVRLSNDSDYDESDTDVAGRQITINLSPQEEHSSTFNFNSGDYGTGDFYLVAKIDTTNIVTESSEINNTKNLSITIEPFHGHTVQGYVKYSTGTPFSNVTVRLTGNGENLTDYTQGDGYYHFDGLADGSYTVTPEKTGWIFDPEYRTAEVNGDNVWLDDMLGSLLPPEETISKPGTPTGEMNPVENNSYTYTTSGATSSLGHTVEYQFNWGDGSFSIWSTSKSADHKWDSEGLYTVAVIARCKAHPEKSNISDALMVEVVELQVVVPLSFDYTAEAELGIGIEVFFDPYGGDFGGDEDYDSSTNSFASAQVSAGAGIYFYDEWLQEWVDMWASSQAEARVGGEVNYGGVSISSRITFDPLSGNAPFADAWEMWHLSFNGSLYIGTSGQFPDGAPLTLNIQQTGGAMPPWSLVIRNATTGEVLCSLGDSSEASLNVAAGQILNVEFSQEQDWCLAFLPEDLGGAIDFTVSEPPAPAKKRLIIDTDPAVGDSDPDDGTAIIYAFQSPELCTIEGITYGYGNFGNQILEPDGITRGSDRMLDYYLLQLNKIIEVLHEAGAIENYPNLYRGHKKSETWDNNPNPPSNSAAVEFIRDTVRDNPGQISVVALGTLTNIASAIASYPDGSGSDPDGFMRDCRELWIIGGAIILKAGLITGNVIDCDDAGNCAYTLAEWNIWRDRIATEYVLLHAIKDTNGAPKIKMVPLNASMRWLIKNTDIEEVKDSNTMIANYLDFPLRWWINECNPLDLRQHPFDLEENFKIAFARKVNSDDPVYSLFRGDGPLQPPAFPPYDTIGMALALEPNIATWQENHKVYVSLSPLNAGETIEDDTLSDREGITVFYDYNEPNMTERIVNRWKRSDFHQPSENKKFVECSDADYVIQYNSDQYASLRNVSDDIDGYYHLPVGAAPYLLDPYAKYRGRMIFDVDLPNNASVNEVKLHIYCDKKTDWADTDHRVSIYRSDPDEDDPAVIWASASPANAYYSNTHIGTLQAWRTVNLGGLAVSDFQQTVATCGTQFGVLLAEDGDDDSCVWFDTSKDWKAYLEVTFDACPIGDISGDCQVDFTDFGILANQWLQAPGCPSADIAPDGGDGLVDISDLALLAEHWLEGTTP
jgi:inosine-uridine nucleoside N-ribohydrolase